MDFSASYGTPRTEMAGWNTMSDNNKEDEPKNAEREFEPEDFPLARSDDTEILDEISTDIRFESDEQLLSSVKARFKRTERDFALLCRDLYLIDQWGSYRAKGYDNFQAYWAGEFGQPIKNADKLINIFKKYVQECGIDLDTLKSIGVTKAQTMFSVINKTNAKDLVEKATSLRVSEFRKEIAKLRPRNNPHRVLPVSESATFNAQKSEEVVKKDYNSFNPLDVLDPASNESIDIQFRLFPEQVELVRRVIFSMKKELNTHHDGHALVTILQDYEAKRELMEKKTDARQLTLLSNYEKVYGGKIYWIKDAETAGKILKLIEENGLGEEIVYERD